MAIEFACPSCGRKVRAPNERAGKRGTCPYCGKKVDIPQPTDDDNDFGPIPISDEADPQTSDVSAAQAVAADAALRASLDRDQPEDDDDPVPAARPSTSSKRPPAADAGSLVVAYIREMSASRLDAAEQSLQAMSRHRQACIDYAQQVLVDELPPAGIDLPRPVLHAFLRKLIDRLGAA